MNIAMTRWFRGRTPRTLLVSVVLASCVSAGAAKLPVKTIEVLDDGSIREILDQVGKGMRPNGSGGQIVRKVVGKVPGKVPWGGALSWGPFIIQMAMDWAHEEGQRRLSSALENWLDMGDGWYAPRNYYWNSPSMMVDPFIQMSDGCQIILDDGLKLTLHRQSINGEKGPVTVIVSTGMNVMGVLDNSIFSWNGSVSEFNRLCEQYKAGKTLDEVILSNPEVASEVTQLVKDFIHSNPDHPEVRRMFEPAPTINQYNLDLIDPTIISVPESPFGDGDYLQEKLQPESGNRKHPLDGTPLEPWPGTGTPVNIDKDLIPDWRDGDDNGDGVPDDQQTPEAQKSGPGDPGYGRRLGDTGTTRTVTIEKTATGEIRTTTTTTTSPTGDVTTRKETVETTTKKEYTPGTPAGPGTPGTPGTITNTTTTTTTNTTTTINYEGDTIYNTSNTYTNTDKNTYPGPQPQIGDKDGDGKPDEEDPHPNDPLPEEEEENKGKDGPAGPPYLSPSDLPEWDFTPVTNAIERNKKEIALLKSEKLPFAASKMLPQIGTIGNECQDIIVGTANNVMGNITLDICDSSPSRWMHGTGRAMLLFVFICLFCISVVASFVRI